MLCYFAENGVAVISVDYRLAPEHKRPSGSVIPSMSFADVADSPNCITASDDANTAWAYIVSQSKLLNINTSQVVLWGCSVGAALASGLAMRLKATGEEVQPKIVILDRQVDTCSKPLHCIAMHIYKCEFIFN